MAVHTRCVRECEGATVLLVAPAGHYKTNILREFAQRVAGTATVVLRASAARSEQLLPFAVVEQLVNSSALSPSVRDELRQCLDAVAAATPQLAQDSPALPIGPANSAPLRQLCRVFEDLAATTSIVVTVDDAQDADRPSVELLLHLGRRLRALPLVLVFAERPELTPSSPDLRARLSAEATDHLRRVAPLGADHPAARTLPDEWIEISGGNPVLVDALITDHHDGQRWPGDTFDTVVSRWVHTQDVTLVAVASALATGVVVDSALVARVLDIDRDTVERAMSLLAEIGPLRPGQPPHGAVGAAVLRALPAERRARLHLDLARALYYSGADGQDVVHQLTAAGQAPDEWAFQLLWTAADSELAADRLSAAVDLLQLALRGKVTDRQRTQALVAFARIEWRNNPGGARRYYRRMVAAACAGHCDDHDLAATVKYLAWHGAYPDAERVLDFWCTAVAENRWECTDELQKTLQWTRITHFQLVRRVPAAAAIERDKWSGTARLLGIQAVRGILAGGPAQPWISDAEQILRQTRLSDPSLAGTVEPLQAAILALLHAGQLDLAAARAEELLTRVADLQATTWLALVSSLRAEIAVRRGEPQTAVSHARRALDLMDPHSWGVMIGIPLSCLVTGLSQIGQHDEAARVLAEPVPEVMFETRPGLYYLNGRAVAAAAQDRWHAALRDHERCGTTMREHDLDLPVLLDWRTGAAQARLKLGRPDLAASLVQELLKMPGADLPGVRGPALRVLAATKRQPRERLALLSEAARLLADQSGSRLELSQALHDLSQAHRTLGETSQARTLAEQAARRRAESLTPTRPQRPRPASDSVVARLSEAERRVAVLAADGHTNRAVADALFITVSTVEQHLTRIYRKLNITRRRELTMRFRQELTAVGDTGLIANWPA
ncbi:MAG TPA: LuxR C-terminal-related transcriptional regulator [Kutzneria sp.]